MATQGKAKFISKGLRRSCNTNKKSHPMSHKTFLLLSASGGTGRVKNDQIFKAMISAINSPKSNPKTVLAIVGQN